MVSPTQSLFNDSSLDSSDQTAAPIAPVRSTSSKDSPLATITTKPADPELAPDLSQSALEHYNDIDTYLELSGAIKTKKKKKKKKKASNSSVPSQPVDEPIAAVGSMSVMDEEELDPLERKNDPRYRPIEDSEFVGWGECIDSPTATPNNPILFYV
ncbi:hypothetical protein PSTT_08435 [Puccinia striiformis]|uniref:Uncharacterized protein n=1 Tax=Puccinia striiformis TaxID=27350 RepID=A0A2S4VCD3_9BASI|nr:hypothetical protein PSTT_08435 [Puccinia striiformis]